MPKSPVSRDEEMQIFAGAWLKIDACTLIRILYVAKHLAYTSGRGFCYLSPHIFDPECTLPGNVFMLKKKNQNKMMTSAPQLIENRTVVMSLKLHKKGTNRLIS